MKFSKNHEWVTIDGDTATMGITEFAAQQLGDVTFVELPDAGTKIQQGKSFSSVESVKTVSDIFAPMSGEITEVNTELEDNPALVNEDAQGKGWIAKFKVADKAEYDTLLDEAAYKAICEE